MSIIPKKHPNLLSWVEISKKNLIHNLLSIKKLLNKGVILAPCVKANAYGHGLKEIAKTAVSHGADWLCVNDIQEAALLRQNGIKIPLLIIGYVMKKELKQALNLDCRLTVYNKETIKELALACEKLNKTADIHIKIETGNNRQGVLMKDFMDFARFAGKFSRINIEGVSTHFANIEDIAVKDMKRFLKKNQFAKSGDKRLFPRLQLDNFLKTVRALAKTEIKIPYIHCANSAAAILYPNTHFNLVRPGIAVYGLWPSQEVKILAGSLCPDFALKPVMSWKTRVAQIKKVKKNSYIGYGCTYKTTTDSKIAVLPAGYFDGYDRGLSNKSHVLIRGRRAPVRGRVCMNMIMADVTKIRQARLEDEAVLLGKSGGEKITAEHLAKLADTINYEITTRIRESMPRIIV